MSFLVLGLEKLLFNIKHISPYIHLSGAQNFILVFWQTNKLLRQTSLQTTPDYLCYTNSLVDPPFSHSSMQLLQFDVYGSGIDTYIQVSGEIILVSKFVFNTCNFFIWPLVFPSVAHLVIAATTEALSTRLQP